jgi:hypothetical protein
MSGYAPRYIGKCLYCGSTANLTDEHIVPYGLGGPWKLLDASCEACNKITSAFEREVLREFFILVRTKLGLPTYHPKQRPQTFQFAVEKDEKKEVIEVPVSDCPTLFIMPLFEKPGYITGNAQRNCLLVSGTSLHGSDLGTLKTKYNLDALSFSAPLHTSFAKLLVKIAYGMVVAQYGLDAIDEAYVIPSILGLKNDVGYWVGCEHPHRSPDFLPPERFLHRVHLLLNKNEVGARVRLFASFQTPEYLIIVGRLKTFLF